MKKFRLWTLRALMVIMGLFTIIGMLAATQTDKLYDERTYLLVLSLFALLLFWKFAGYVEAEKKKQKQV